MTFACSITFLESQYWVCRRGGEVVIAALTQGLVGQEARGRRILRNVRRWGEYRAICGMCGSGRAQYTPKKSRKRRRSDSIGSGVNVSGTCSDQTCPE